MTLPGPEVTHRWQGRTLVDRNGQAVGSIQTIYVDKATALPEWALLEAYDARPAPTFVPLASASEEGDTVRVPYDKTLVEQVPSVPVGRELSEDQEAELYRHYGVPYSRAESPSGLPAGEPLPAGAPPPAATPSPTREPDLAAGVATSAAGEPVPPSRFSPAGDGQAASWRVRISDPRVAAAAGAALAVGMGVWRREAIGRQISRAISRLGAIPGSVSRQRRRRRRARTINQAVSGAAQKTTALAWGTARVLAAVALLSVTAAVRGGRRTWAGAQAAQQAIRQGPRRRRPAPRRRRRRRGTFGMVVGSAAPASRLAAIPRRSSRQRRRRRRAKAINQAVTGVTQKTTGLARTVPRLLAAVALLPVTAAVRGGRRTWAGAQAAQQAIRQGPRRRRPAPRRRRRRRGTFGMVVGGAAGYVLGAKAGEQGYRDVTDTAKRAGEQVVVKLDRLSGQAADKLQRARESPRPRASGGGDPSITAAPGTPPEPRSQPAVATPEATTPPAEATSPAKRKRPAPPTPPP